MERVKMKYMGSKRKISKHILPIILDNRKDGQYYVEPFCGGCNSLDKVGSLRIGADNNKYLIALLKKMQDGEIDFPFVGESEYKNIKDNKDQYPDWLLGYVGFQLSFGAKWFGGYRRDKAGVRDYENEAQQNLKAQQNLIIGVEFSCCDYWDLYIPRDSIVYCDPPYEGTTRYKDDFDHRKFWDWVREKSMANAVFVSEYSAPPDFECLWSMDVKTLLDKSSVKTDTEKLFKMKG